MSVFTPPPTYAQVLLTDPSSGEVKFNPIWLNWFLQLADRLAVPPFVTFNGLTRYQQITLPSSPPAGYRQFSGSLVLGVTAAVHQVPDGTLNLEVLDSVAAPSGYVGRRANGTFAAKTGVLVNNEIAGFHALGYGATAYASTYQASMQIYASENFTDTAKGTFTRFTTTRIGTVVPVEAVRIWDTGDVSIGGPYAAESLRAYNIVGSTRWIKASGSVAGNPTLDVSGGKLGIAAALVLSQATLVETSIALTNGAAAAAGTLNNAPAAGNPTKWFPINDNGTVRYVPSW